jgi:hypothetical protein
VAVEVKIDTREFNAALREYIKFSKRSLAEIVNKRAVNICFRAIRHTPAARRPRINRDLRQKSRVAPKAQLGPILVNYNRGRAGKKGLQGKDMAAAVEKMRLARHASVGFVKSGWFGAIRDLQPSAKVFRRPPRVIIKGRPKGYGKAARQGINPTAEIVNQVEGAVKVGRHALQRAMNEDALDMRGYVAKKMQQDADRFNAR